MHLARHFPSYSRDRVARGYGALGPQRPLRLPSVQPDPLPPPAEPPGRREPVSGPDTDSFASLRALPLIIIVTVQAYLSLGLVTRDTAFTGRALYLWAGRLEWSHWLHNTASSPDRVPTSPGHPSSIRRSPRLLMASAV